MRGGGHAWQTKGAFAWIQNTQLGAPEPSRGPRLAGFAAADVPAAGDSESGGTHGYETPAHDTERIHWPWALPWPSTTAKFLSPRPSSSRP